MRRFSAERLLKYAQVWTHFLLQQAYLNEKLCFMFTSYFLNQRILKPNLNTKGEIQAVMSSA